MYYGSGTLYSDPIAVVVVCVMFYFLSLVCPCFIFYLCGE